MRTMGRIALIAAFFVMASIALLGCGGGDDKDDVAGATTTPRAARPRLTRPPWRPRRPPPTPARRRAGRDRGHRHAGRVPVGHPGAPGHGDGVREDEVTDTTTVHQLTVRTASSFDEVVEWYKTKLPAGWSVGFIEVDDGEAKIALNGGDYAPASPDGRGGGVIIGVFEGDTTEIVTTATVMAP